MLLQACGHNPTGCDPSHEQWNDLIEIIVKRKLIPFFDTPYLGFVTGNFEKDSYVFKAWAKTGKPCFTT